MNNKDIYKKAIDQIHASENLKEETILKMKERKTKRKIVYLRYLSVCAVFVLAIISGKIFYNNENNFEKLPDVKPIVQISALNKELPRFESLEELKEVLKENNAFIGLYDGAKLEMSKEESVSDLRATGQSQNDNNESFSTTNVQVENVDEADIVKTDGNYIYYITQNIVYIIKADTLDIINQFDYFHNDKERFNPFELFINKDKLIVIGNYYKFNEMQDSTKLRFSSRIYSEYMTEAIVFDISDKANPTEIRTVRLDGNYRNSRMIGENIYLISSKNSYYYDGIKKEELLPRVYDSLAGEKLIEATDIAYFKGTESYSLMTVAGFDINNDNGVCSETFFGASDTVYASENNLYITQVKYEWNYDTSKSVIYKFKLDGSNIELLCKGEVDGNLNNQFSMDEYNGNLRIATTSGYDKNSKNQLFVLDENLQEIGKIENMAVGEKIYSVRFIGKIGYVVTFEQIDPLFVIDLSDPRNPEIKGELKIPGYSSYLHPYDENHIIGIGYNTKSNGYGGVTNSNMKMSMFDVSDLENPKELFNVDIGDNYAYSDIMYNHKVLFQNKQKDLIGFPVTYRNRVASKDRNSFIVFHIDLEKGFEKYGEVSNEINYKTNIQRAIYIGNTLYTLSQCEIKTYRLDDFELLQMLEFEEDESQYEILE